MNYKPIITYFGSNPLFRSLESQLTASLPLDACEWKRSYGRANRNVHLEPQFRPFDPTLLAPFVSGDWSILAHPVLHIYVTDCCDVDAYKSTIKEEIDGWLRTLHSSGGIADWMILLVETVDSKKSKNLLPRTTVLDKLRLDFGTGKTAADRCVAVLNPVKHESKATESFRCLLNRMRALTLAGFNRNVCRYEELMRAQRDRRTEAGWCYVRYFGQQEQLASVLEQLGLHQEALLQYDELEAMFGQLLVQAEVDGGERPEWLRQMEQHDLHQFHGITMNARRHEETRRRIAAGGASVLEFRSYVFERQTALLAAAGQHAEVADRFVPFVYGTLREMEVVQLHGGQGCLVPGALACWQFVCAMEVLQLCDAAVAQEPGRDAAAIFQYTAAIWSLAKDRLYELGALCGLLPGGGGPTSEQLHAVVQLSAGIGDSVLDEEAVLVEERRAETNRLNRPSATDRLKQALGSAEAFTKLYLELSELAISTYKHVSRLRSARLVGRDLGEFYCALGEPHKAIVFFGDVLRDARSEKWPQLVGATLLQLAGCYRSVGDTQAYTQTCAAIACCVELGEVRRVEFFEEFQRALRQLKTALMAGVAAGEQPAEGGVLVPLEEHLAVREVRVRAAERTVIQDDWLEVEVVVWSRFPAELLATEVALSYELVEKMDRAEKAAGADGGDALGSVMLPMSVHLDFKQDNTLDCASVVCDTKGKQQLVRRSSSTRRKVSPTTRNDFTNHVSATNILLAPGPNTIALRAKATRTGSWNFRQLSVCIDPLELLSESLPAALKLHPFEVTTKAATAMLSFKNLIAGVPQPITLIVSAGSHVFAPHSQIHIRCSKYLLIRRADNEASHPNPFRPDITVSFDQLRTFEERRIALEATCELPGQRDDRPIEHLVTLLCPWSRTEIPCQLHFQPPITASCRLHSSETRKFLQIIIKGASAEAALRLSGATMQTDYRGVRLTDRNPVSQREVRIVRGLSVSYLWEIEVEPLLAEGLSPVIKVQFGLRYALDDVADTRLDIDGEQKELRRPVESKPYTCKFDVSDYATLFRIQAKVDASELCRVGSVCQLSLRISKVQESPYTDLMYEVMGDQNIWAVCGRSAGVVSMRDIESQSMILDVLPLSAGFLPMPNIRLSKYIAVDVGGGGGAGGASTTSPTAQHPKLQPFPPGQVYNATKSMQIHVLAGAGAGD